MRIIMVNKPAVILGHRVLNQDEIDLINEIKEFGPQLEKLCTKLEKYLQEQYESSNDEKNYQINLAEPYKWHALGKDKLQEGLMCLTRSVAQPTFF
jgi:hypothetical protein